MNCDTCYRMDTQSFLTLVKPQGHLVTKSSWNCLKKSSLICLICCLPKHFKFCFCTLWWHPTLGNIWLQSLPKALLPPLLIPTSAPWHPSAVPAALQIKPEKNPSLKRITCFGRRMEEHRGEALQGFFFFLKTDEFPDPFDSKAFSRNTNRFYYK